MKERVRIIGSYLSPYVRKVLVVLDYKNIPYEIDPIIPFFGNDRFSTLSPLRRIPVLIDDQVTLADSSVICQYLEDRYPDPALYPKDIALRASARWLEEFADTRMGEVFIWHLFNQVAIGPFVWGETIDQAILQKALSEEIPHILDYLETQLPAEGYIFGELSIADIAIACFFRNAGFARFRVDAARWPRTAGFVQRLHAHPSFAKLIPIEDRLIRTPPLQHREVLLEMGLPIMTETYATPTPRRGLMQI
jgi:glutathione S-transferase